MLYAGFTFPELMDICLTACINPCHSSRIDTGQSIKVVKYTYRVGVPDTGPFSYHTSINIIIFSKKRRSSL